MIALVIGSAIFAAAFQTSAADGARSALRTCLKSATAEAKTQKMAKDAVAGFIRQMCTAEETSLKAAVLAVDSKNKVTRKQSEADGEFRVEDFVTSAADRYAAEAAPQ